MRGSIFGTLIGATTTGLETTATAFNRWVHAPENLQYDDNSHCSWMKFIIIHTMNLASYSLSVDKSFERTTDLVRGTISLVGIRNISDEQVLKSLSLFLNKHAV